MVTAGFIPRITGQTAIRRGATVEECGRNSGFKRRDATHFHFDVPVRGMNPTATINYRYAILFHICHFQSVG